MNETAILFILFYFFIIRFKFFCTFLFLLWGEEVQELKKINEKKKHPKNTIFPGYFSQR